MLPGGSAPTADAAGYRMINKEGKRKKKRGALSDGLFPQSITYLDSNTPENHQLLRPFLVSENA
jgi:hypothetical protein